MTTFDQIIHQWDTEILIILFFALGFAMGRLIVKNKLENNG